MTASDEFKAITISEILPKECLMRDDRGRCDIVFRLSDIPCKKWQDRLYKYNNNTPDGENLASPTISFRCDKIIFNNTTISEVEKRELLKIKKLIIKVNNELTEENETERKERQKFEEQIQESLPNDNSSA